MDIYIDILLLENISINYLIMWLASRIIKVEAKNLKLLAASTVGALYALLLFFPGYRMLYSVIMKVLLSFLMIVIAYTPSRFREFVKELSVFYLISFVLGGAVFGLFYFTNSGMPMFNGIFFIKGIPPIILLGAGGLTLIFVQLCVIPLYNYLEKRSLHQTFSLNFEGNEIKLKGLVDTGNALYDPITKYPVIIVEYSAVKDIIPDTVRDLFEEGRENDLDYVYEKLQQSNWMSRLRLIPYSSIGKEKGILIGFKADRVALKNKRLKEVIVAIHSKDLSENGEYSALLNPELLK